MCWPVHSPRGWVACKTKFYQRCFFCSSFRVVNIDMSGVTWADDRGRGYGCGRMTSGGGHVLQQVCAALCTSAGRSHTLVTDFPASEKRSLLKNVSLGRAIPREYQGQVRERRCLSWQFYIIIMVFVFVRTRDKPTQSYRFEHVNLIKSQLALFWNPEIKLAQR